MLKRCVFNRLSIGMIPKSYRESLTYEEQILWLQKYVNDMLEWLTKLQEDFDNIDLNFDEIEAKIRDNYNTAFDKSLTDELDKVDDDEFEDDDE